MEPFAMSFKSESHHWGRGASKSVRKVGFQTEIRRKSLHFRRNNKVTYRNADTSRICLTGFGTASGDSRRCVVATICQRGDAPVGGTSHQGGVMRVQVGDPTRETASKFSFESP